MKISLSSTMAGLFSRIESLWCEGAALTKVALYRNSALRWKSNFGWNTMTWYSEMFSSFSSKQGTRLFTLAWWVKNEPCVPIFLIWAVRNSWKSKRDGLPG